jgi:Fanconi-associated nuclease 1
MTCIPVDELRRVARGRKIPPALLNTRQSTMCALKDFARRQTTLSFAGFKGKGKGKEKARHTAPSIGTSSSEHLVVAQLLPLVGGHVLQIDRTLYTLITRVNLIFSRTPPATSQPALLLPPILVQSNKRHYPEYTPQRSRIWDTRNDMLIWERAVSWETLVSEALGDIWAQVRMGGGSSIFAPRGQPLPRVECARVVRKVWQEVWPIWKTMVAHEHEHGVPVPPSHGGDRFRREHVLTRVVHKGAEALGILHEYDLECAVLRALLAQRRWRRGKRG